MVLCKLPSGASNATDQCSSCHDLASEHGHMITVSQCSVKFYSTVGRCSLAGKSPTADVHIQLLFCVSVVQVKRCRLCLGFT